jgi:hypothetical protein
VARVVWTVQLNGERETSSFLLGPGHRPPGLGNLIAHATLSLTSHWLRNPDDEAAVNFDTVTGLVDVHRHGEGDYGNRTATYWVSGLALADPPQFAQPLGPLFTGTLESGGAPVLADWFEEKPDDWAVLATVLRSWPDFTPNPSAHVRNFQYVHTSPNTACWQFGIWDDRTAVDGEDELWVIGLGVFGPDGLERAWHFSARRSDATVSYDQFWSLFPAPPRRAE